MSSRMYSPWSSPRDPILENMKNMKRNQSTSQTSRRVTVPVAKAQVRKVTNPSIRNINRSGDIKVAHREFISDLNGSTGFAVNSFAVNPGLSQVFPWLSSIARRYESYRFEKLKFSYETGAPTSATGSVLGAIDYDASDPSPQTKVQVMSYRSAVRSPPWSDFCMESKKEDLDKRSSYFIRKSALSANEDVKLYDVGNFFLCTQGQADSSNIGELYVEYVISLMTPQLDASEPCKFAKFTGTNNSSPFDTKSGNLDVTVSSTGSTSSVTTATFNEPFEGYVSILFSGTGLGSLTFGGTVSRTNATIVTAGTSTPQVSICDISAQAGETLTISMPNTTLTSNALRFSQAEV